MTAPAMDCRTCQPTLIDLLYGELATDAAEEAHVHLQRCPSCRGALDKLAHAQRLSQRLSLIDPPTTVADHLHRLAEQTARANAARQRAAARPTPRPWQLLLDFVGRFATGRQVGMVTITMLIVAVGLWSLPQLRHKPTVAGGTAVNPEQSLVAPEPESSSGVQPAEPLDLEVDLRAGRIRSNGEATGQPGVPPAGAAVEPRARKHRGESGARVHARRRPSGEGRANQSSGAGSARHAESNVARRQRPTPRPEAASRRAPQRAGVQAQGTAPALAREARSDPAAERYASGNQHIRGGNARSALRAYTDAAQHAKSGAMKQRAWLAAARAREQLDGCSGALALYERVLEFGSSSAIGGEALLEMARCRLSRGEPALARSLLERAAGIPKSAGRATALLRRIEAAEAPAAAPSP